MSEQGRPYFYAEVSERREKAYAGQLKNKKEERDMARPSDYRQGYRKNTRNRQKKENKFYTKANNGDILNKRLPGIDEIKQNIEAEKRRAQEYENEWLDSVVNDAGKQQTDAAKARAQEAKNIVKDWNEKLSEAYGLGVDGYWNRGTQQPITQQSEKMRATPEHAYGIGQYRPAAEQQKPAAIPRAAGSAKGREIMQLQDTLVHNPGMSDREKNQVQEKINNLTADKEVLDWKDANPGRPTKENYQTQIDYYNRLITQAQDDMVNALGSGNVSTGDEKWYEYHDKVDELVKQRDAYNRGMMGLLDGEKAQTAEEATATETARGGGRSVSLDANDGAVYTKQPEMDDEEDQNENGDYNEIPASEPDPTDVDDLVNNYQGTDEPEELPLTQSELDEINEIIQADIDINDSMTDAREHAENYFDEDFIANANLEDLSEWQIGTRKQMEIDAILEELDKQMAEEIANLDNLKNDVYQEAYDFFDENPNLIDAMKAQIITELKLYNEDGTPYDLSGYSDEEIKEMFAQSSWSLDPASQTNTEEFVESIKDKYEERRQEEIDAVNDTFEPYEKMAELGLSDLWEINNLVGDEDIKKTIESILDIPNKIIAGDIDINIEEYQINSVYSAKLHYLEKVLPTKLDAKEKEELKQELNGIYAAIASQIPGVDIAYTVADALNKFVDKEEEFDHAEIIEEGTYREYNIDYNTINGSYDQTIIVEVDEEGYIKQPPHVYAYNYSSIITPYIDGEGHNNTVTNEIYETGGIYQ